MSSPFVILPALNEVGNVGLVVKGFLAAGARPIVVDNGSIDGTAEAAQLSGATVVTETRRGYGWACRAGIAAVPSPERAIVVFADCDGTLDPEDLPRLILPLREDRADLVLGVRSRADPRAWPVSQRVGNWVLSVAIRALFRVKVRDVSPYRAVRGEFLERLALREGTYGFPAETVARTIRVHGRLCEVGVAYQPRRSGRSKVGGTVLGTLRASVTMLTTCLRIRLSGESRT